MEGNFVMIQDLRTLNFFYFTKDGINKKNLNQKTIFSMSFKRFLRNLKIL